MSLSPSQKRYLRSQAHHLKPVVMVGQHGLTDNVLSEIDSALDHHEMIKVRISGAERDEKHVMVDAIRAASKAELVQLIGHIAVLFRRNSNNPKITLPKN
jgi:RNA-binding protein